MSIITFKSLVSGQQPQDDDIDGFYIDAEGNPPKIYFKSDDDLLEYQCRPLKGGYKLIRLWNDGINFASISVKTEDKYEFPVVSSYRDDGTQFNGWRDSGGNVYTTDSIVGEQPPSDLYATWTHIYGLVDINMYKLTTDDAGNESLVVSEDAGTFKVDYWDNLTKTWKQWNGGEDLTDFYPRRAVSGDVFRLHSITSSTQQNQLKRIELYSRQNNSAENNKVDEEWIETYEIPQGDNQYVYFQARTYKTVIKLIFAQQDVYTVHFDATGGNVETQDKSVTVNAQYGDLPVPSRSGYTFEGWYTAADGGNHVTATTTVNINADQTLYAHWSSKTDTLYTVKHYQQNVNNDDYTLEEKVTASGTTGATLTLENLKKTYTGFKYLEGKVGEKIETKTTILADGSRVIKLYYKRQTYTVTLNEGTGINTVTGTGTYKYGKSVTINAKLKDGYSWVNWTGPSTLNNRETTITIGTSNVTYTANGEAIKYTISYNLNGGSDSTANPTEYYVTSNEITLNNPTKKGYTFAGWKGTGLSSATKTVKIAQGSINNRTYEATWEIDTNYIKNNTLPNAMSESELGWSYIKAVSDAIEKGNQSVTQAATTYWCTTDSYAVDDKYKIRLQFKYGNVSYCTSEADYPRFFCRSAQSGIGLTFFLISPTSKTGYPQGGYPTNPDNLAITFNIDGREISDYKTFLPTHRTVTEGANSLYTGAGYGWWLQYTTDDQYYWVGPGTDDGVGGTEFYNKKRTTSNYIRFGFRPSVSPDKQ